jgi:hypothetical protein
MYYIRLDRKWVPFWWFARCLLALKQAPGNFKSFLFQDFLQFIKSDHRDAFKIFCSRSIGKDWLCVQSLPSRGPEQAGNSLQHYARLS